VTRLQTHFSNVDAVIGYYKDVMVQVGAGDGGGGALALPPAACSCGAPAQGRPHTGRCCGLLTRPGPRAAAQIDGNRSMDAVFASITNTLDKLQAGDDPMEVFCMDNPAADECRVYE
jgi:hypothetical protein